jgi:hypothetical protein
VVITSITDARIPWPRCRAVEGSRGGGSGLWLAGDLAKAVRRESAAAVMFWWRASRNAVLGWRKALSVTRTNNEGTQRLIREASQFGADVMKERKWTDAEREEYRRRSKALGLQRHRREGYYQTRGWKPEELLLLGKRSGARCQEDRAQHGSRAAEAPGAGDTQPAGQGVAAGRAAPAGQVQRRRRGGADRADGVGRVLEAVGSSPEEAVALDADRVPLRRRFLLVEHTADPITFAKKGSSRGDL